MGTSIKRSVMIRVICALIAIVLFSGLTTVNILRIKSTQAENAQATAMLDSVQRAEVAHYKWSANLSNAMYAGMEFTGSLDHTSCVLGKWLYGTFDLEDSEIERLRAQIEPLHRQLHVSASTALELYADSPVQGQQYYLETIQSNLTQLVGLLDQVVDRGTTLTEENSQRLSNTIAFMHITNTVCLVINLVAQLSLWCSFCAM